jgi:CHASE3 domain sensor protein
MVRKTLDEQHEEFTRIMEELLREDLNITAREIARRHTTLSSASTITRHPQRRELMKKFQERQSNLRGWRERIGKNSRAATASKIVEQQSRITELEATVDLLTMGHVSLIAAVAQLGGMGKLAKFYEDFGAVRERLDSLGAIRAS